VTVDCTAVEVESPVSESHETDIDNSTVSIKSGKSFFIFNSISRNKYAVYGTTSS
jgi:hypothetical protein